MGTVASRMSQGVRDSFRACSGKRRRRRRGDLEDDEARLSTYESEQPLGGGAHERAVSVSRTCSRASSLGRLHQHGCVGNNSSSYHYQPVSGGLAAPSSGYCGCCGPQAGYGPGGYTSPSPRCCRRHHHGKGLLIDTASQTTGGGYHGQEEDDLIPISSEPILSREYMVKTYSIQNATPSPSPAMQAKFPNQDGSPKVRKGDTPPPRGESLGEERVVPRIAAEQTRTWKVQSTLSEDSLRDIEEEIRHQLLNGGLVDQDRSSRVEVRISPAPQGGTSSTAGTGGQGGTIEQRQEDVLRRLEVMQTTVAQLALRYKVADTVTATTSSSQGSAQPTVIGEPGQTIDLVINADPSSVPLSLVSLCKRLTETIQHTSMTTFLHSSVGGAAGDVPDRLRKILSTNGLLNRADSRLAVTFIWKKVSPSPQLVVDPVHQTAIHGEGNVARYLWGLFSSSDLNPVKSTQEDELVDLAELQVCQGNNKEKAAAVRQLNSVLGKQKLWLMGGETPSLADYVCWSSIQQAGLASGCPANVQRWLKECSAHPDFAVAQSLVEDSQISS